MDNITNNIYLIDRIEMSPKNDVMCSRIMNYNKVLNILGTEEYYKTSNQAKELNPAKGKFSSRVNFVIKNKEFDDYVKYIKFPTTLPMFLENDFFPGGAVNYYLINYYDGTYNFFSIVFSINVSLLNDDNFYNRFYENRKEDDKPRSYLLTLMKYHFEETNNLLLTTDLNYEVSKFISSANKDYKSQQMIEQPSYVKSKLFDYQRANIKWMLDRESGKNKIHLSSSRIVNFGPTLDFNFDTLRFQTRKTINDFPENEISYFKGGCLADDVGLGKTVQILTLCAKAKSRNLIVVPDHLLDHWECEFKKHIDGRRITLFKNLNSSRDNCIVLASFTFFQEHKELYDGNWTRVIFDEFHEVVSNNELHNRALSVKSEYKWAVTATPFINSDMIFNIINLVISKKLTNSDKSIGKYNRYFDTFCSVFRKNTKKSTTIESLLPPIRETIYYLGLSVKEKFYYDSLDHNDLKARRLFCINPSLYFQEHNKTFGDIRNIDEMDDNIAGMHMENYKNAEKMVEDLKAKYLAKYKKTWDEIKNNEQHYRHEISEMNLLIKNVNDKKSLMTYFNSQVNAFKELREEEEKNKLKMIGKEMEDGEKKEEEDEDYEATENGCGICLGGLDLNNIICFGVCGHSFHQNCWNAWCKMARKNECVVCKRSLDNTIAFVSKKEKDGSMISKYGTKIAHLINICKNVLSDNKIVIFSHTPSLLSAIVNILNLNGISSIIGSRDNIVTFTNSPDIRVLVLSSDYNASGLNITVATSVILLEPIDGDYVYRRQIENQIVGRLHRIGQTKEINFIRLITKDTIEQEIMMENKINDMLFVDNEGDLETNAMEIEV